MPVAPARRTPYHALVGRARGVPAVLKCLVRGALLIAGVCAGMARADTPAPPAQGSAPAQAPAAAPTTTGRILGRLTDAGKPVQGAQVRLLSRSEAGLLRVTSSDQRGEYRFKDLPSGIYDVEVEADGFRLVSKPGVEVKGPFQNIVDVPLARAGGPASPAVPPVQGTPGQGIPGKPAEAAPVEPPVTVHGTLLNGDRRPVVDVSVLFVASEGTKLYQATSGSDGVFTVESVVPGRYRAVIRSPGHMPVDLKSVEVKPGAGLTLNLSLVDFPLNFKARAEGAPPPELPRVMPGMLPTPAAPATPSSTSSAPPPAPPPTAADPIEKKPPAQSSPPSQNPPPAPPPDSAKPSDSAPPSGSAPAKPGGAQG